MRETDRVDYSLSPNYDILFTKYHLPEENGIAGLDLFREYETEAFGAMGYYTLQDFEEFAKMVGISDKRLIKIFNNILLSTDKVYKLIEQSYLSSEAKIAYAKNYKNRLEKCLCYSIESYPFKEITQDVISKVLLKK
ncbi:MAG: hypothetical protein U9R50_12715 [Campylobacterota bacterium]|nr:hypothetical protein [Campylobacterota bacterium]